MTLVLKSPWLGAYAMQAIEAAREGKVAGLTSKGAFLLFGRKSVFLTSGREYSPFNIMLNEEKEVYEGISIDDGVFFSIGEILFPRTHIVISLHEAQVWTPPAPLKVTSTAGQQTEQMKSLLSALVAQAPAGKGLLPLVKDAKGALKNEAEVRKAISELLAGFDQGDLKACLAAASGLFGLGGGLTPSGDDLLAGFLLYHARLDWARSQPRIFAKDLAETLTSVAYETTTWVSANRLEAAGKGWSEPLFLEVVDFLFGQSMQLPEDVIPRLLNFGHSSGVDTLLGIAAAANSI